MLWFLLSLVAFGAIVNGPLFSLDASGAVGKAIVYTKWKGRNVVREYVTPANPNTPLQRGRRTMVGIINKIWGVMTQADKDSWIARAAASQISTFNAMTGFSLDNQSNAIGPTKNEGDAVVQPGTDITLNSATAGNNRIDIDVQTDAIETDAYAYAAISEIGSTVPANLLQIASSISITAIGSYIMEITGLPPGTYEVTVGAVTNTGGALINSDVATGLVVTGV